MLLLVPRGHIDQRVCKGRKVIANDTDVMVEEGQRDQQDQLVPQGSLVARGLVELQVRRVSPAVRV
ncbi:hypothetical protein D1872_293200 [compost metagenome]